MGPIPVWNLESVNVLGSRRLRACALIKMHGKTALCLGAILNNGNTKNAVLIRQFGIEIEKVSR